MRTPLDDIKFLANSAHRIRVLTRLADTPADRHELQEETGISQRTLGRILVGFRDRGCVERRGRFCDITVPRRHIVEDFAAPESNLERYQKLQLLGEWLPLEEMGFDAEPVLDATITTATPTEPDAALRRAETVMSEARDLKFLGGAYVQSILDLLHERTAAGDLTLEAICSADVVALMRSREPVVEAVR